MKTRIYVSHNIKLKELSEKFKIKVKGKQNKTVLEEIGVNGIFFFDKNDVVNNGSLLKTFKIEDVFRLFVMIDGIHIGVRDIERDKVDFTIKKLLSMVKLMREGLVLKG